MPCPFLGLDRKLKAGRQNDAIDPQETLRAIMVGVGWAKAAPEFRLASPHIEAPAHARQQLSDRSIATALRKRLDQAHCPAHRASAQRDEGGNARVQG